MAVAKVTSKGQVTLPKEVREALGINKGDELEFRKGKDGYKMKKHVKGSPFSKYVGYLRNRRGKTTDKIIVELRGK